MIISSKSAPSAKIAFYLDQAAECSKIAASATLQNVRERSLRSEAAWRKMAGDIDNGSEPSPAQIPNVPTIQAAEMSVSPSTPSFASFG
ncbi:hypothetical protein [Aureimonas sp. Leaf427]|nr:hypothetical protein [Aureimonas sp. Leaf427]